MTRLRSLLPHPILSAVLAVVWVLIANDLSVATVLMGIIVGIIIAKVTSEYWPGRPRVRRPLRIVEYVGVVMYDIVAANLQVAVTVFFRRAESIQSQFVTIPVDLRSPEAIAALAGTITMTPGTVAVDVSEDRKELRVHCLDTDDPERIAADIKRRYERRLRRIFE